MRAVLSRSKALVLLTVLLIVGCNSTPPTDAMDSQDEINQLVVRANSLIAAGYREQALPLIERAIDDAGQHGLPENPAVLVALGQLHFELGHYTAAQNALTQTLSITQDPALRASAQNTLASIYSVTNEVSLANEAFASALESAKSSSLKLAILANQGRHLLDHNLVKPVEENHLAAWALIKNTDITRQNAHSYISLAMSFNKAFPPSPQANVWTERALHTLTRVQTFAEQHEHPLLLSYALGYQGTIASEMKQYDEARPKLLEANFLANSVDAFESAYLWQWELARIEAENGSPEVAIKAYLSAIDILEQVREELITGSPFTFPEKVKPLFSELSSLLLVAAADSSGTEQQALLRQTQEILEQAKSAELQDYFQNECTIPEETLALDQIEEEIAVIYPVILHDRLELLVNIGSEVFQFQSEITSQELTELVNEIRYQLEEDLGDEEYLELSEELYGYVVAPLEDTLQTHHITTLVVIPDGALRTIPFSALYDGNAYLVERYAIATTPGINLTLPRALVVEDSGLFAGGLSEAVQGFVPLPGVPTELSNLKNNYGASVMQDTEFQRGAIIDQLASSDFSIVHIATHGHFDQNPQESFLLTFDDKLTMDNLEQSIGGRRFTNDPLELLLLSACESAAGDQRAALGLAGVALKAGARSALATLWQISDAATVELVNRFYEEASKPTVTKAEALREAQIALIKQPRFSHPTEWAPFLLIGNWL